MSSSEAGPPRLSPESITIIAFYAVAFLTTIVRLAYRLHRKQASWDDFWAFVALFSAIFVLAPYVTLRLVPSNAMSDDLRAFLLWSVYFMHPTEIWATRLCISVTLVRILPQGRLLYISKLAVWAQALCWLIVVVQKVFLCGVPIPKVPVCSAERLTPILNITLNVIASIWQVVWPVYISMTLKLPSNYRRLLIACFSTSLLVGVSNVVHNIYCIVFVPGAAALTGQVEVILSLFLCNMLVLVSYIYRVYGVEGAARDETKTTAITRPRPDFDSPNAAAREGRFKRGSGLEDTLGPRMIQSLVSRGFGASTHAGISSNDSSTGPLTTLNSDSCYDRGSWGPEESSGYTEDELQMSSTVSRSTGRVGKDDIDPEKDVSAAMRRPDPGRWQWDYPVLIIPSPSRAVMQPSNTPPLRPPSTS